MTMYNVPRTLKEQHAVIEAARQWVEDNRDDCYQDDTEAGYKGRVLMERVDDLYRAEKKEDNG